MSWVRAGLSRIAALGRAGVILAACLASISSAAAAPVPRSVLVLYQWEENVPWYGVFFDAFNATIRANSPEPIAIFAEQLDLGRFKSAAQQEAFHRYIVQKYSERDIGIIISIGPSAVPFTVALRAEMWPEASMVFAAATDPAVAGLNLAADITGSIVETSPQEMIGTARALVPNLQHIALVGDLWDGRGVHHAQGFGTEIFPSAEALLGAGSTADCLLLDIHLDGMGGFELRRRLSNAGSRLPVIFMTAFDDDATRHEAANLGCVAYLRKPFAGHLLMEAITDATT